MAIRLDVVSFRKVLVDAPCSGDGTLRKGQGLWRRWRATEGNALHQLQLSGPSQVDLLGGAKQWREM